jgi:hypothetical protein
MNFSQVGVTGLMRRSTELSAVEIDNSLVQNKGRLDNRSDLLSAHHGGSILSAFRKEYASL